MTRSSLSCFTACLISIFCFLAIYSCQSKPEAQADVIPSAQFAPYVSAYTGGIISQASTIRVELSQAQPVVDLNSEIKNSPFSFSPSLKGKAYWVSNNIVEFVPEEGALKPGQFYKATFRLDKVMEIDKELQKFEFSFRVMERNFAWNFTGFDINEASPEMVTIRGDIRFSDQVDKSVAEKMITARINGKEDVTVTLDAPAESSNLFNFTISDVPKKQEESKLNIEVSGKPLKIDRVIREEITIPARATFKFISAKQISEPENGIEITFSEPLSPTQDLRGLISLESVSNLTFQVESNKVNVYFERGRRSSLTLNIYQGIRNYDDKVLGQSHAVGFTEQFNKPQVNIMTSGTILPDSKNLIIPFRAVSLYAVDLSIIRVFENNVLMFMQDNSLSSAYELRRSGRLVYKKMIRLDGDPTKDLNEWEDYSIDLTGIIQQEPGAIYRVMLSFKQEYSAYPCGTKTVKQFADTSGQLTKVTTGDMTDSDEAYWDETNTYYNFEYGNYNWSLYEWSERENPCHPTYYMLSDRIAACNVLATNLGVVVKKNANNKMWISVNDIITTAPVQGADVSVYNFQLQNIGTAKTDAQGFVVIEATGKPFAVVAAYDKQKTYIKVIDGEEQSTTRFDVAGKEIEKGLKGYVYGERGVWRPGDTLHVTFILEDVEKRIPEKHPVTFELYNPRGQFYSKLVSTSGTNGFYTFQVPTDQDDPTGLWNAYVKVGGATFHKPLRIETVKPNRLKINLEVPPIIKANDNVIRATLNSAWLTGATAANLKAKVEMSLSKVNTQFSSYSQYIFNNPATEFTTSKSDVFDGTLDATGKVSFNMKVPDASNAPGMLRANITTRVFEPGGDASINTTTVPFSPFSSYVGINLNQPKDSYLETDVNHVFDLVTVDADGKIVKNCDLEYQIFRISWSWWWESKTESFESYINSSNYDPVQLGRVTTGSDGKAKITFKVDYPSWGRYLVYVRNNESGHATGGTVYIDWPSYRGRSNKSDPSGVTMLSFSLDKSTYEIDETATAYIPSSSNGRALIAIENGSNVLHREWIEVSADKDTQYKFKITPEMAPNVYLHISLLQPHAQTANDLPIRMYGIMPVFVTDKNTILEPQISMPDVLRPEKEFSVTVSEKTGKPMTYTLAIVDDGLLDLTNFKTPNPWDEFYAREALGIRTWDMFDAVIGAYTGVYSSLFSVGGDEMLKGADSKANRFRPVVKFLGPFTTQRGGSNTHKITLPMYVGSVRTMVVAGQNGAYGNAEKTTPVRTPLMVLSSLPRVLSVGEDILLPVNVFAMEDNVKQVNLAIETSDNLQLVDGNKKTLNFAQTGDQIVYFRIKTGLKTGKEVVKITASGGGETTKETIEIDVRNPNPITTHYETKLIDAGASDELTYQTDTKMDESWVKLEVSRIPSVDISRRFDYLYNYDHYCTEQLTSRALPLLFVSQFKDVDKEEQERIKTNVQEAIKNLYGRQLPNGGFVYWPGQASANEWITSYAGSFLVMAREKGYEVNNNVLNKWKNFQRSAAQNWAPLSRSSSWYYWQSDLQQAYRLYTLALAGAAEMGAMNRMKEMQDISLQAKWRLAAAYALNGKVKAGNELVFNAQTTVEEYSSNNNVYGSYDRDEAMILETLILLGKDREAFTQAQKVSKNLSSQNYFSTQSTAFSLMAMGRLAEKQSGSIDFDWSLNGVSQKQVKSAKAIFQADIPKTQERGKVSIKNNGKGSLYVDLISRTRLLNDTLPAVSNNLKLEVTYTDMNGKHLDISKLQQGTDFKAIVKVSNISGTSDYRDIALTHIIPSGWEIYNDRMLNPDENNEPSAREYTYRDIRDDRVLTYFDLYRNQAKVFVVRLQASYAGTFTLPAVQCEAMYDLSARSRTRAGKVTVER